MHPPQVSPDSAVRCPRLNGRYVVVRLIGRGAQARVYVGWDLRLKQWRAIKVLAANFLDDEHVRARFEQEAQAMARLAHPNLVRVVDIDHDGETPYLVMELARGGAVTDWMKRTGPVPPVLACRIAQQCCDGLHHAHQVGVVHRDVKPHNVLIRDDGSVMLTDFGIAQVTDSMSLTATGTIMGTFAFMAPEQRTDAKGVDARADVYSLGATLFTMLTGKTSAELFFAESRDAILAGIPELLRPVILMACRYERDQRYASMLELRDALERRISRLPFDPPGVSLASNLLPLPDRVPEWAAPDAGVEDLARSVTPCEVTPQHTDPPTFLPPMQTPTPAPTYDPRSGARRDPLPYRMPERTADPVEYLDRNPVPRDRFENRPFKIDLDGPKSLSAEGTEERVPRGPLFYAAVGVVLSLAALLGLVGSGIAAAMWARHQLDLASVAIVQVARDEHAVVGDLMVAGADPVAMQDRWDEFDRAPEEEKARAAAAFAEAVAEAAEKHRPSDLARTKVEALERARRDWLYAEERRRSLVGNPFAR